MSDAAMAPAIAAAVASDHVANAATHEPPAAASPETTMQASLADRSPAYSEDRLRRLFAVFDRDGNGFITAAELAHSMARLGHALTVRELTGMIEEADTDGDGRIDFHEFSRAITAAAFDNVEF